MQTLNLPRAVWNALPTIPSAVALGFIPARFGTVPDWLSVLLILLALGTLIANYWAITRSRRMEDYLLVFGGISVLMPLATVTGLAWARVRSPEEALLMASWTGGLLYGWYFMFTTIGEQLGRNREPQETSVGSETA